MNLAHMHLFATDVGEPINTFVLPFVFTDKVKGAVESIWRCHSPMDHRLILIDNSGEEFVDWAWLDEHCHFYLRCYRNLGPAVSFNLGILLARTKYVTVFSDDARLIHWKWFADARDQVDEKTTLSLHSMYYHKIPKDDVKSAYTEEEYDGLNKQYGNPIEGFGLATAIAYKETWLAAGLFDESKYIYWIDGTFMQKAKERGIACRMAGVVLHYGDASHKGRLVESGKYNDAGIIGRPVAMI